MRFSIEELRQFNDLLKFKAGTKQVAYKHLDELIRLELLRHAEKDRIRGVPFLQPTRVISTDYKIKYNEHIELFGEEIAFTSGLLDDVIIFEDIEIAENVVEESLEPTPQVEKVVSIKQTPKEQDDHLWDSILEANKTTGGSETQLMSETGIKSGLDISNTTDLIEFVRNNNGCTVQEALKFFTIKEINKQLRRGRVFKSHGRLSL